MPQTHVRWFTLGKVVGGGCEHDRNFRRSRRLEKGLGRRNDHIHVVAEKRITGARPGVGQIDVQQRGPLSETDASLESSLLVQRRIDGKDFL